MSGNNGAAQLLCKGSNLLGSGDLPSVFLFGSKAVTAKVAANCGNNKVVCRKSIVNSLYLCIVKGLVGHFALNNVKLYALSANLYCFVKCFKKGFLEGIGHYTDRKSFFHNYLSFQLLSWRDLNISIVFSIAARVPGSAFS